MEDSTSHIYVTGLYRPVGPFKFALSIILPSYLAYNGIRKKSLTTSGALAGQYSDGSVYAYMEIQITRIFTT